MRTYTAKNPRQFIKRIEQIKEDWESKDGEPNFWFRGSQNTRWLLVPKLYRPKAPVKDMLEIEDEIREEFVRRVADKPGVIYRGRSENVECVILAAMLRVPGIAATSLIQTTPETLGWRKMVVNRTVVIFGR